MRAWGADKLSGDDPRLSVGTRRVLPTDSNANYFWMLHFLSHLKDGGTAIPYNDEDPYLRKEFEETLAKEGAKSRMESALYEK